MLVTAIGGAIGFVISIGICELAAKAEGATQFIGTPVVSPTVATLTAIALGIVGIVAGYFPAREASRLDPVEGLRYE